MFFEIVDAVLQQGQRGPTYSISNICLVAIIFATLWLVWRLWKFYIGPILWPDEPFVLPYAIPIVGHTISFLRDPEGTLRYGNQYFKSNEPYAISVGGLKLVIIRDPRDVASVWKDTKALTFDYFMQNAFRGIGVPKASYEMMFQKNPARLYHGTEEADPFFVSENPSAKRYIDIQEDWIKEQLQPGERMNQVQILFLGHINETLRWDMISPRLVISADSAERTVSLYNWCRYTLVDAGSKAFLGLEILDLDPDFVQHYIDWEDTSWKVAHQHPNILSRDMHRTRKILVDVFTEYYALHPDQRPGLSWLFDRMQSEQQKLGLKLRDAAAISVIMLWGVHLNTFRILFWALAHILCDPALSSVLSAETASALGKDGLFDINHLTTQCPLLNAVWLESLRLYSAAAVVRNAERMTVVGGKTVRAGTQVMGPFRFFHLSNRIFGDNALDFDAGRWVADKSLANVKGFHPFGGGKTYCPGRVIARQEVCLFIATVLSRFELEPLSEKDPKTGQHKVPMVAVDKPALTALDPKDDLLVRVRRRKI